MQISVKLYSMRQAKKASFAVLYFFLAWLANTVPDDITKIIRLITCCPLPPQTMAKSRNALNGRHSFMFNSGF